VSASKTSISLTYSSRGNYTNAMPRSTSVHKNPNILIALCIVILVVIAALLSSPAITNKKRSSDPNKIVKNLEVKELGLKVGLTEPIKDLTYKSEVKSSPPGAPERTMIALSQKNYTDLVNKCVGITNNTVQVISTLVKIDGQGDKKSGARILQQFPSYYIVNQASSLPPENACKDMRTRTQLKDLSTVLNKHIENAFGSAKLL
jgi:hypothetical protein